MSESNEKKELKDSLSKCRCCLRLLIDDRRAVEINETIQQQFFDLTNLNLLSTSILSNRLCQLCASDLQTFSSLRADLLEKQRSLYVLAEIDYESLNLEDESEAVYIEEEGGYEKIETDDQFELIEEDCDTEILWDDGTDGLEEAINDETAVVAMKKEEGSDEGGEDTKNFIKIEKIRGNRKRKISEVEANEIQLDNFDSLIDESYQEDEPATHCSLCGVDVPHSFFDYHTEQMHMIVACDQCEETFESKILLKRHDLELHPVFNTKGGRMKKKSYLCTLCDKQYEYKKHLEDHIRSFHKKVRNAVCHICHRAFYHRDIKKHIEHVHGTKTVECGVCGKFYSCHENLKLHMKYHEAPRYQCEIPECGKKFHQRVLWEHHMLKHTKEKPIGCPDCGNLFYTLRDLKRHTSRSHTRVFRSCFGCEASFYRKDKYREHVIKHHKDLNKEELSNILAEIRAMQWNKE